MRTALKAAGWAAAVLVFVLFLRTCEQAYAEQVTLTPAFEYGNGEGSDTFRGLLDLKVPLSDDGVNLKTRVTYGAVFLSSPADTLVRYIDQRPYRLVAPPKDETRTGFTVRVSLEIPIGGRR